jgi:hypothetical protein
MRILLIEDFGKRQAFEEYILNVFGDLLGKETIYEHWSDDERNLTSQPEELLNFFKQHSAQHDEAVLCRHYSDFDKAKQNWHIPQDFDAILIDINLSEGVNRQQPVPDGYIHEKGGFYIYNELIRQGFSYENICFLTAEGDTLSSFIAMSNEMSMPKPLYAFEKTDKGFKDIRNWLNNKHSDAYLTLRRGIITGCQYLLSRLTAPKPAIPFGEFLKQDDESPLRTIAVPDMQDYLETLQNLLPLRQPENPQRLYKLFLRNLAHEWDAAYPDQLPRCEKGDKDCFQARTVKYTFGWIMKCARNWAAHTTVLDKLSEPQVAFLFILAMRAMFELPDTCTKSENILLSLFEKTDHSTMTKIIGTTPMKTKLPLSRTYLEVKNQLFQSNSGDSLYFHTMLNNLLNNQVPFDYVTGLFQMFWHGLSPVRLYERGTTIDNNQNVVFKYSFWLNDYGINNEEGFLFELARSIYKRSFNQA